MSTPVLTVDLDRLAANYRALAQLALPAELGVVAKADGYGLGAARTCRALYALGARSFFVAHTVEAVDLRSALPAHDAAIYILNGFDPNMLGQILALDLCPVLNSLGDVAAWHQATAHLTSKPKAAIQFDTGMNRLGLEPADCTSLQSPDDLNIILAISHLAVADDPAHPMNASQIATFKEIAHAFPGARQSLLNSSGLVELDGPRFDLVRPGIALWGGLADVQGALGPVAQLTAEILQIRDVAKGEVVGYGAEFCADSPRRVATIALGYADGYPRNLGGKARMWLETAGCFAPVIGRVSMDLITLDVTQARAHTMTRGARVEAFGLHVPLEEVAALAETIPYEILTRIGPRVARVYKGGISAPAGL